jgi:hypothetical protein
MAPPRIFVIFVSPVHTCGTLGDNVTTSGGTAGNVRCSCHVTRTSYDECRFFRGQASYHTTEI